MKFRFARPLVVGLISMGVLAAAPSAFAAEASLNSGGYEGGLAYSGGAGADNNLTVSYSQGQWHFVDTGVTRIVAGGYCWQGSTPNSAICSVAPEYTNLEALTILVGDGDDSVLIDPSVPALPFDRAVSISGGAGDDFLIAGQGRVSLKGEAGNNRLVGSPGNDRIIGGEEADTIRGGAGADVISALGGRDSLSYASEGRTAGVRVVLDDATPAGREGVDGIGDTVYGIEDVTGTPYTDVLTGNASNNVLRGNGGADQLTGLAGEDTLIATGGPSWLDGGDGNDSLQAKNTFKDYLGCGNGTDTAKVDPTELFVPFASCETLTS